MGRLQAIDKVNAAGKRTCGWVVVVACLGSTLFVSGCKAPPPPPQQKADYSQTINKYYEGRPLCLWKENVKFPIEAATQDQIDELGLDELAQSGLLISGPAGSHKGTKSFDLSPEGRSALSPDVFDPGAGNFCYGRRKIVSIDAARRNSSTTELVDYHYSLPQPAAWATEAPIQEAFPSIATELAAPHMGEATLLDTTGGWEMSGTPATILPPQTRPHTSTLAKAKAMLHMRKAETASTP